MTKNKTSGVGYRSPPEHTRFEKGKSGNPRGRPRKREDLNSILERVLTHKVGIKDNARKIPIRDALIWKLRELALQGDKQALALQRRILTEAGLGEPVSHPPIDAKARAEELAKRLGLEMSDKDVADE